MKEYPFDDETTQGIQKALVIILPIPNHFPEPLTLTEAMSLLSKTLLPELASPVMRIGALASLIGFMESTKPNRISTLKDRMLGVYEDADASQLLNHHLTQLMNERVTNE